MRNILIPAHAAQKLLEDPRSQQHLHSLLRPVPGCSDRLLQMSGKLFERHEIYDGLLPHRLRSALIDSIEVDHNGIRVAHFITSFSEEQTEGHFPGNPIVRGADLTEFLAQGCAALIVTDPRHWNEPKGSFSCRLVEASIRFAHPIRPLQRVHGCAVLLKPDKPTIQPESYVFAYVSDKDQFILAAYGSIKGQALKDGRSFKVCGPSNPPL